MHIFKRNSHEDQMHRLTHGTEYHKYDHGTNGSMSGAYAGPEQSNLAFKGEQIMRNATLTLNSYLDDMLRDLNRFAVGYEPTIRMLDNLRSSNTNAGFPPYDLEKLSDTEFRLSMAVAGYGTEDLEITEQDGVLTVTGSVQNQADRSYLHKGIAGRSFKRHFYLDQHVYVKDSYLNNGILVINFVKEVPEALKPRTIVINSGSQPVLESKAE
jgi:molecular chaperone IbpA